MTATSLSSDAEDQAKLQVAEAVGAASRAAAAYAASAGASASSSFATMIMLGSGMSFALLGALVLHTMGCFGRRLAGGGNFLYASGKYKAEAYVV